MTTKKEALIVDIDGTLANVDHRLRFIRDEAGVLKKDRDWHAFHKACIDDEPFTWCKDLVSLYKEKGHHIFLITGRGEEYLEQTLNWLKKHGVHYDDLYMRPLGDQREDHIIKKEIYTQKIEQSFDVSFVLEDRKSVVAMWRESGLTCLQCAPGDF